MRCFLSGYCSKLEYEFRFNLAEEAVYCNEGANAALSSFKSCRIMDQTEEAVQTSGSKTLLVRHLPAELSQDEKEDLLKYFGAQSVRVFSNRGRMVSSDAYFSATSGKHLFSSSFTSDAPFLPTETRCLCNVWKREIGSKSKIFSMTDLLLLFLHFIDLIL